MKIDRQKIAFYMALISVFVHANDVCFVFRENKGQKKKLDIEYCAEFVGEDFYRLKVVEPLSLPFNRDWVIPDTIIANCTGWRYLSNVFTPRICGALVAGGGAQACLVNGDNLLRKLPVPDLILDLNSLDKDRSNYYLPNAKNSLKPFYGKKFEAEWSAKLLSSDKEFHVDFTAVLIGECQ